MAGIEHILMQLKAKQIMLKPGTGGQLRITGNIQQLTEADKALLARHKTELLAFLENRATKTPGIPELPFAATPYPLSPAQKQIWAHEQLHADPVLYSINSLYRFEIPSFSVAAFTQAVEQLVAANDALRTRCLTENGEPQLITVAHAPVQEHLHFYSLTGNETDLVPLARTAAQQPFPAHCSPWQIITWQLPGNIVYFFFRIHHLLADGESLNLMLDNLMRVYTAGVSGTTVQLPTGISFRSYIHWLYNRQPFAASAAFWKKELEGYDDSISLPDLPFSSGHNTETEYYYTLCATLTRQVNTWCTANRTGINALFTAAIGIVLGRYIHTEDLVLGVPAAARTHPQLQNMVGNLVNNLPLRLRLQPGMWQHRFVQEVKEKYFTTLDHQLYPFAYILEDGHFMSRPNQYPLFSIMLSFPENRVQDRMPITVHFPKNKSLYALTCTVFQNKEGIQFAAEYDSRKFTPENIRALVKQVETVLKQCIQEEPLPLSAIKLLTAEEETQWLKQYNHAAKAHLTPLPVIKKFYEVCEQYPQRTAIVYNGRHISYAELQHSVQSVAATIEAGGIRVAVIAHPSPGLVIAMLAIWHKGGVYIPVDPTLPPHRITQILEDARPEKTWHEAELNEMLLNTNGQQGAAAITPVQHEQTTYILYTSGTTGAPKGVMIGWEALAQKMQEETELLHINEHTVTVALTAPVFDVSFLEILLPLLNGGKLVIPTVAEKERRELTLQCIVNEGVTILQGTPSFLAHLLGNLLPQTAAGLNNTLRIICSGGESLNATLVQQIKNSLPNVQLNNHYGPTEATIDALVLENIQQFTCNNIGRPIAQTLALVTDKYGHIMPSGVAGHLLLGGPSLATGYWNSPELTAGKFFIHPGTGKRFYRTGDRALYLPNGEILFLGRNDNQVKLNGYRLELEEVNAVLLSLPGVTQAYTRVHNNGLVSWVAPVAVPGNELREQLYERLPAYMVPAQIIPLAQLPLNRNGKPDEHQLPLPDVTRQQNEPVSPLEEQLLQIWQQVLEQEDMTIHDNFFMRGGHSLNAIKLLSLMAAKTGIALRINDLFLRPTVQGIAALIGTGNTNRVLPIPVAQQQPDYPVSYAQQQVWVAAQQPELSRAYHMPAAFLLPAIQVTALHTALVQLIQRYEILRTGFRSNNAGAIRQYVQEPGAPPLNILPEQPVAALATIVEEATNSPFNLEEPPLFRVTLAPLTDGRILLHMVVHHIISDFISDSTIYSELFTLYRAAVIGAEPELAPVSLQYKDYAVWQQGPDWQQQVNEQKNWWVNRLAPPLLPATLPFDFPEPLQPAYTGRRVTLPVSDELYALLQERQRMQNFGLFAQCLAAYWLALYPYHKQTDLVFGCPVSGRTHPQLAQMPGLFLNMVLIRIAITAGSTLNDLLSITQTAARESFRNDACPFNLLQEELGRAQGFNAANVLHAVINMLSETEVPAGNNHDIVPLENEGYRKSKFPLCLFVHDNGKKLELAFDYQSERYKPHTVEAFARRYGMALEALLKQPTQTIDQWLPVEKPVLPALKKMNTLR
ncbi:MAG: amino acid adenylation domain-containing protein [Dinghuibacter sp.]|nr:amino acid adenylation domain-containing protein [Dinghuibacter sp.]